MKEIESEKLKVKSEAEFGSPEKPIGVTIYDRYGKPACILVEDAESGTVKAAPGKCGN